MAPIHVVKNSGTTELYDESKFRQSLSAAGAAPMLIEKIVKSIQDKLTDGIPTHKLYKKALSHLHVHSKSAAGRYRLKEALYELGGTGSDYPFKTFITNLLTQLGYDTETDVTVPGKCITHDIDLIAEDEDAHMLVDCHFLNREEERCNARVPLCFHSQFEDLRKQWEQSDSPSDDKIRKGWIITNARFTYDAEEYGKCTGLKLLSWDYPRKQGIKDLVGFLNLYPVTCLTSLTKEEKHLLIEHNIILCSRLLEESNRLESIGINSRHISRIVKEAEAICGAQE